jgi:hypothetical protein
LKKVRRQAALRDPSPSDSGFSVRTKNSWRADFTADDYAVAGAAHFAGFLVRFRGNRHRLLRYHRIEQVANFDPVQLHDDGLPKKMTKQAEPPNCMSTACQKIQGLAELRQGLVSLAQACFAPARL